MAKKIFDNEHEAETSWQRAISFTRDVRGDEDRADEIEDMGLDQWLEETGRRINNPIPQRREKNMARKASGPTRETLLEQVATLESENVELKEENENLNDRLNQIFDIAAEPDDQSEDDGDSDFEEEDSDEEFENDDD